MLTADLIRFLLPALIGLPIVAALVVRLSGQFARVVAISFATAHLVLTLAIVLSGMTPLMEGVSALSATIDRSKKQSERTFAPHFVPGDPLPNGKNSYSTTYDILT